MSRGAPSQPQRRHHWSGSHDPARQHRPIRLEALPDNLQAELVEAGERGQVRAGEGSVKHVGAFRMDGVRTSILGGPRPLPSHRRADHAYTVICEEPLYSVAGVPARFVRWVGEPLSPLEPVAGAPGNWRCPQTREPYVEKAGVLRQLEQRRPSHDRPRCR